MLRRSAPRDPGATREALLAAGTELFSRHGFDGATSEQIARRARVNKALINYHFRSKQGLYEAIVEATVGSLLEELRQERPERQPAPARLERFIRSVAELNRRQPSFSVILLREMIAGGPRINERIAAQFGAVLRQVGSILAQGAREGSLRRADPFLTHLTIMGSMIFFHATAPARDRLIQAKLVPIARAPDPAAFAAHLLELLGRGLETRRGAEASRRAR
ncbi:MAG TPA: TetR family transcriptional regulator [Candidatus Polarisedimenticolia bacterium]|nr:TetR family transcriptional regulator [Candidatus Polarisedimenticolia bacterium]